MRFVRVALLALVWLSALVSPSEAAYECWKVPDAALAAFPVQSHVFSADLQVVMNAIMQTGVVYSPGACLVTAQVVPNFNVAVAACTIAQHGTTASVSGSNVAITPAHATSNRIDLVSADCTGAKVVTAGAPVAPPAFPLPPTIPQSCGFDNVVLAEVYVPAADNAINSNQISDRRGCIPSPSGGGGGGAPTTAQYLVGALDGGLSAERLVTNTTGITWDLTTAGQAKANLATTGVALGTYGSVQVQTDGRVIAGIVINDVVHGGTGQSTAPDDNLLVGNGTLWQLKALPNCPTGGIGYTLATNAFGCNTFGGSVPTGTGFTHNTAGVQDAASKLVDTADINAAQVTYAKIQNVSAASLLLGRGSAAGAGVPQEIIVGSGLTMTGTTLSTSAGGGNVSNVGTPTNGQIGQWTGATTLQGITLVPVANGGTNLASGTSGGVLAYTASGVLASSGALTANLPMIGGGAGAVPTVGTRSGNTTAYVTTTGTQTSGDCVKIDANGNHVANGSACGGGGGSATITTFATAPPAAGFTTLQINSLTARNVTYFFLPGSLTLNQLSVYFTGITTAGTVKLCLYTEDGATKPVDITITPASGVISGAVASVALTPGGYYAVVGCATTCNVLTTASPAEASPSTLFGFGTPAGKNPWHGTVTHTSGTCNSTLGTVTGSAAAMPILRGDN